MNAGELSLWTRCRQGEETARKDLILLYLPLAMFWAKKISMIAGWANAEDLKQDGVIGLIKAVERFDPIQGVEFRAFARSFIRGAIFDGSEFTRDLARRQKEIYLMIRRAEDELTKALLRNPTIKEVSEKTELTIQQILNAIDAMGVASAGELPDPEGAPAPRMVETPRLERTIMLMEALAKLSARDQEIIHLYSWEDRSPEEIAQRLGLKVGNVIKIRQRAIKTLGKLLDVERKGGDDEYK